LDLHIFYSVSDFSPSIRNTTLKDDDDYESNQKDLSDELSGSGSLPSYDSDALSTSSRVTYCTAFSESGMSDLEISNEISRTKAFMLLNCLKKHNLTSSARSDILRTLRQILPSLRENPLFNYTRFFLLHQQLNTLNFNTAANVIAYFLGIGRTFIIKLKTF
jgi:hypothetical protein